MKKQNKKPTKRTNKKSKSRFNLNLKSKKLQLSIFVLLFAFIGTYLLIRSFAATPNATEKMGVYRGSGKPASTAEYENWLGRPVNYALDFLGGQPDSSTTPWATIDNPGWWCGSWANSKYNPVFSVAILPTNKLTLAAGARGDYNDHWKKFAEVMVARGCGNDVMRLGWEFNGAFYNWSISDKADGIIGNEDEFVMAQNYAEYWRQIVTTTRQVPGANFKFDWCPLRGRVQSNQAKVEASYPSGKDAQGRSFVDYIGLDSYDTSKYGYTLEKRWQEQLTEELGLQWLQNFAVKNGKPITIPEWGITVRPHDSIGGGDNPYYIQKMYDWMNSLPGSGPGSLAYHSYFEYDANDGNHRLMLGQFPDSAAMFKKLFGVLPSSTPVADTQAPSVPTGVTATTAGQNQIDISWQASTDNVGVTAYDVYRNSIKIISVTSTSYSNSELTAGTKYDYYVVARDAAGNKSANSATASATTNAPTTTPPATTAVSIPFRMNSGAGAYTDGSGQKWNTDQYFVSQKQGGTYSTTSTIAGTSNSAMYKTERWGISSYNIPVANGTYNLRLHFAEINPASGTRVFNVSAENDPILTNFNISAEVGNYTALIKDFTVTVQDNELNIGFANVSNSTKLSGLEILAPIAPEPTTPSGVKTVSFSGEQSKYATNSFNVNLPKAGFVKYYLTSPKSVRYDFRVYNSGGTKLYEVLNVTAPYANNFEIGVPGTYKITLQTRWWSKTSFKLDLTYPY